MDSTIKTPEWFWNARLAYWTPSITVAETTDEEMHAAAVRFAGAGINAVMLWGYHFRWSYMDDFQEHAERLGRVVQACHRHDIKVIEHHSSTYIFGPQSFDCEYQGHLMKDWFCRDLRTGKTAQWIMPGGVGGLSDSENLDVRMCCLNNPSWQQAYSHYIRWLFDVASPDGLMHDDIHFDPGHYACGCRHCVEKFEGMFGYAPPLDNMPFDNYHDPVWRDWQAMRRDSAGAQFERIRKVIGPDKVLFGCNSAGATDLLCSHWSGLTYEEFLRGANVLYLETLPGKINVMPHQPLNAWSWKSLFLDRKYFAGLGSLLDRPAAAYFYPGNADDEFVCRSIVNAVGHRYIRQLSNDNSISQQEKEHEKYFYKPKTIANVALYFSRQTANAEGFEREYYIAEWKGWSEALIEENILFEVISDWHLDNNELDSFATIIAPNCSCMSDGQAQALRGWVERGGTLITTHETSLRDQAGRARDNFALASVLGADYQTTITRANLSQYFDPRFAEHELAEGLPKRLAHPAPQVQVMPHERSALKVLSWLERTNSYQVDPLNPAMYEHSFGKGRVLYFSGKPGVMAHTAGAYGVGGHYITGEPFDVGCIPYRAMQGGSVLWIDERQPEYCRLLSNVLRNVVKPRCNFWFENLPPGVLSNGFRAGKDASHFVFPLLNCAGLNLSHNDEVPGPEKASLEFPKFAGSEATLHIAGEPISKPLFLDYDRNDCIDLEYRCVSDAMTVSLPLSLINRFGLIVANATPTTVERNP